MDAAFAAHQTDFILYGKNLNPDDLDTAIGQWEQRNRATIKSSNIDYTLSYNRTGYLNPDTKQIRRPNWYHFNFTY